MEGTANYKNWKKSPFPLYMEIYLFNWTNYENAANWETEKPNFEELGPYVFEEIHERVDIDYFDKDRELEFNQTKTWWFNPGLSKGSLSDLVTTINPVAAVSVL